MKANLVRALGAVAVIALVLGLGFWFGQRAPVETAGAPQQASAVPPEPVPATPESRDPYQRSQAIFEFTKAATSGIDRGREIFYYKCWFCHNEWAEGAPRLTGIYQKDQLLSGRPANDAGVREEIREGGAGMAAYKYTLSEQDLNDLVAFVREGCCWNSDAPPPNPDYRSDAENVGQ